jgi:hypothetical protein
MNSRDLSIIHIIFCIVAGHYLFPTKKNAAGEHAEALVANENMHAHCMKKRIGVGNMPRRGW